MTKRRCFGLPSHTYDGTDAAYEKCPQCGLATIPCHISDTISSHIDAAESQAHAEMLHGQYHRFFACPNGYECMMLGNYEPSCEDKIFKLDCIKLLAAKMDFVDHKLDKILDLLHQTSR